MKKLLSLILVTIMVLSLSVFDVFAADEELVNWWKINANALYDHVSFNAGTLLGRYDDSGIKTYASFKTNSYEVPNLWVGRVKTKAAPVSELVLSSSVVDATYSIYCTNDIELIKELKSWETNLVSGVQRGLSKNGQVPITVKSDTVEITDWYGPNADSPSTTEFTGADQRLHGAGQLDRLTFLKKVNTPSTAYEEMTITLDEVVKTKCIVVVCEKENPADVADTLKFKKFEVKGPSSMPDDQNWIDYAVGGDVLAADGMYAYNFGCGRDIAEIEINTAGFESFELYYTADPSTIEDAADLTADKLAKLKKVNVKNKIASDSSGENVSVVYSLESVVHACTFVLVGENKEQQAPSISVYGATRTEESGWDTVAQENEDNSVNWINYADKAQFPKVTATANANPDNMVEHSNTEDYSTTNAHTTVSSATYVRSNRWIMVDLGEKRTIDKVVIGQGGGKNNTDRIDNWELYYTNDSELAAEINAIKISGKPLAASAGLTETGKVACDDINLADTNWYDWTYHAAGTGSGDTHASTTPYSNNMKYCGEGIINRLTLIKKGTANYNSYPANTQYDIEINFDKSVDARYLVLVNKPQGYAYGVAQIYSFKAFGAERNVSLELDKLSEGTQYTATLKNNNDKTRNISVLLAEYDGDVLKKVIPTTVTVGAGETVRISNQNVSGDAKNIKVFVWDMGTLVPLTNGIYSASLSE